MFRRLMVFCFLGFSAALVLPFLLSSYYIDTRGITIPGKVAHKREDVIARYSRPKLEAEVSLQYDKPDGSGAGYLRVLLPPEEYDALHVGQTVSLHYLQPSDIPNVPFAKTLRQMHMLPMVRMANKNMYSGAGEPSGLSLGQFMAVLAVCAVALIFWKMVRLPGFNWLLALSVLGLAARVLIDEFPKPMRRPTGETAQAAATVKSVERILRFFQDTHSRGIAADAPVQAVGVEFVPLGRTEPVVALDLIDLGSVPGLGEKSSVTVEYELARPRVAYIQGASRTFVERNVRGLVSQGVLALTVLAVLLGAGKLLGRFYRRLISSSSSRTI